jgi:acyl carrier protein
MITSETLVEFLETELGVDMEGVGGDDPLFSSGLVDSFALVTLMMHLEREGGFRINPADVTLDNLDTIDRILGFCNRVTA